MGYLNGFNESIKISNMEIDIVIKKLMSLSIEEIDKVWFETGWIDSEAKQYNRKALPKWRLEKIKKDKTFAEESFVNLITDDPYQELRTSAIFLTNLGKFTNL